MARINQRHPSKRLIHLVKNTSGNVLDYLLSKGKGLAFSLSHSMQKQTIPISDQATSSIAPSLKKQLTSSSFSYLHSYPQQLSETERSIVRRLNETTKKLNKNNVTRTEAYRSMYLRYTELHWAFLAHMVSRNGGWNMTDLKGELLPHLMNHNQAEQIFLFLERANALIFQDAFPQLLLYEESIKHNKNLFHLLPQFHVSAFMKPFWDYFYTRRDSAILTIALIVNEQNYIEGRVAKNPYFQKHVLDTLLFKVQSVLQLNQVVFPYRRITPASSGSAFQSDPYSVTTDPSLHGLVGLVIENFSNLNERIDAGKKLYATLFGFRDIFDGALSFCKAAPHTGSRADYWPHLFARIKKAPSNPSYSERLDGCRLKPGSPPLYSPELVYAWNDRPFNEPEHYDWFKDQSALRFFDALHPPFSFEMTNEHCFGLNKIELAVLAGEQLMK